VTETGRPGQRRARSAAAPGVAARRVAYDVLRAVHEDDAYANLVLPKLLSASRLEERDRALAAELAYGTLRAEGTLDHVLVPCIDRRLDAVDPAVLDVLRLGSYQLLRTRVEPHAAVSTSVDLARAVVGEGASRFVNAVLRKVAARGGDLQAPDMESDPIGHLAVTYAHPRWIVSAFLDAVGGDLAETEAALAADDERPEVHLVARPGRMTRDELLAECAAAGLVAQAGPWSPYAVRLAGGDVSRLAAVRDGRAGVQDEGSQLCALVAAAYGPRVLDLCAGPGGKAALITGLLRDTRAATVLAVELHAHRAELVRRTLTTARAGASVRTLTVQADGQRPAWPAASFDGVLVDAPCTGLGALRRRPDARWRREPADVPRLATLQRALLRSALDSTRPGGHVTYVVCSPHLAEGRAVVSDAVKHRPGTTLVDARPLLSDVPELGDGPWIQLWPHRHGTDAMFVAVLRVADA
jgi:16S rRNA (cytosine967-C5)-methyltransferase